MVQNTAAQEIRHTNEINTLSVAVELHSQMIIIVKCIVSLIYFKFIILNAYGNNRIFNIKKLEYDCHEKKRRSAIVKNNLLIFTPNDIQYLSLAHRFA